MGIFLKFLSKDTFYNIYICIYIYIYNTLIDYITVYDAVQIVDFGYIFKS